MKLKTLKLRNFRGYRNETEVHFGNLTAFVGRNDAGKSTVLEALEIFFNNTLVKIEKEDLNVEARGVGEDRIEISCIFTDLPIELVVDAQHPTTLEAEFLLNLNGELEIKKVYTCGQGAPKERIFIVANHPTVEGGADLISLRRTALQTRARELGVPAATFNGNINSSIRQAIWMHLVNLNLERVDIQLDKEDAKETWVYLEKWLPRYALFKSDRESSDGDREVTDPMKVAIATALAGLAVELEAIQAEVKAKAVEVAERTLEKLREMSPDLANELTPDFKSDPKWANLFNLTLASDRNIPINKRGSGVRRLIILNFFRAEAERRRDEQNSQALIYAFEEPENSQHPNHQEMLISAFKELAEADKTQVLLTTHNPALAGLIEKQDIRLVTVDDQRQIVVLEDRPNMLKTISQTLGMLPDPSVPRLLVCVEGPNDVTFFKTISAIVSQQRQDLPNLSNDTRIAIFPLGGGTLKDWVTHDYLNGLGLPQYHIYDLDDQANPPYRQQVADIRARGGQNWAELTAKRETENYLCPLRINDIYGFQIAFNDMDDVPEIVASTQHAIAGEGPWADLTDEKRKKKISRVKKRLNSEVAAIMTWADLERSDPNRDIVRWLEGIRDRIG